ncbi:MAG: methylmalonyl Co-A mutase-associated GTPase MeaB, partial [Burkholderiales bacterium]
VDTTVVTLVPESGDWVQGIKAGLMEIADLYVVNKCDRPAASAMVAAVQSCMAQQHHPDPDWLPRVIGAAVIRGEGIPEILAELERHRQHLAADGRLLLRRRAGLMARLRRRLEREMAVRILAKTDAVDLEAVVDRILSGADSLDNAAEHCVSEWIARMAHR